MLSGDDRDRTGNLLVAIQARFGDELWQPVQLLKETRAPIPATNEHGQRVDYEYERNGTASIFMFAEPLSGFRQATTRTRRTKQDWAIEVAQLLDGRYAGSAKVTLVCDNLNTHTKGAFYEAFEPEQARAYLRRINFRYTPKHGSWLNVAECELSCLTSQCLRGRRIGELPALQTEIAAWSDKTNELDGGDFPAGGLPELHPSADLSHE
jgi:DDE superfamily endonuclease